MKGSCYNNNCSNSLDYFLDFVQCPVFLNPMFF